MEENLLIFYLFPSILFIRIVYHIILCYLKKYFYISLQTYICIYSILLYFISIYDIIVYYLLHYIILYHRIKLLVSCIEARTNETPPGCGLSINELNREKSILAAFAIHDLEVHLYLFLFTGKLILNILLCWLI